MIQGAIHTGFRQRCHIAGGFFEIGQAGEIAPDNTHQLAAAEAAQQAGNSLFTVGADQRLAETLAKLSVPVTALQVATLYQLQETVRLATGKVHHAVTAAPQQLQLAGKLRLDLALLLKPAYLRVAGQGDKPSRQGLG